MNRSINRPRVTLKIATSLDGKIALANGQSEWITGELARAKGRELRAVHDAIAVGANTAVLDNPQLTTRISGKPDPIRVVFDSQLRLSVHSNLVQSARDIATYVVTRSDSSEAASELQSYGVMLITVPYEKVLDLTEALKILFNLGVRSLLLEGGGTLAASFLKAELIDTLEWFRAPVLLGAEGRAAIGNLDLDDINHIYRLSRNDIQELGDDMWESYILHKKST